MKGDDGDKRLGKCKEIFVVGIGKGKEAGKVGVDQGIKIEKRPIKGIDDMSFLSNIQMDADLNVMEVPADADLG